MTIRQIIGHAATILGLGDVVELIQNNRPTQELIANTNYSLLLRCMSLVVSKIATQFHELTAVHEFVVPTSSTIQINFRDLQYPLVRIQHVELNGFKVPFIMNIDHVRFTTGWARIGDVFRLTYVINPMIRDGTETNPFPLPHQILEYGVLSEYAFINGMFNEAKVWHEKMSELLFSTLHRTGRSIVMPIAF